MSTATTLRAPAGQLPPTVTQRRRRRRPSGEPPPLPRELSASGRSWLAVALALVVVSAVALATSWSSGGAGLTAADQAVLERAARWRSDPLVRACRVVGWLASERGTHVLWLANLVALLATRRWRHLCVWVASTLVVVAVTGAAEAAFARPRPFDVKVLGPWVGFSMPSLPVAVLTAILVNTLYSLVPQGRLRQAGKAVAAVLVAAVGVSRVVLGQDHPSDVLVAVVIGVTIPLLAFRLLVPASVFPVTYRRGRTAHLDITGARSAAIARALEDQLGVVPVRIEPFGLAGSGGSTPLRVTVEGQPATYLMAKLYAINHVRSDRWYKLGRTLLYGGLEDEKAFNSVRRLVQYEDYALRLFHAAGLPTPTPHGVVEITPEREYLLVMEFLDGAQEIGELHDISDDLIDQGLLVVRRLWDAGLAHRDIKPANLMVRQGRLHVIDSAFAEVRPSPWRQAVDLANMMLVLALSSDVHRVYERAQQHFTQEELAEAFAATRGLTMPSQLRRLMREQGRDLHAEFTRLLPYTMPPIAIQRWSVRRVALSVAVCSPACSAAGSRSTC